MEKYSTPNAASSPVSLDPPAVAEKNDSFLEDVGVIPYIRKHCVPGREAERNVTRRTTSPSLPGPPFSEMMIKQEFERDTASVKGQSSTVPDSSQSREVGSGDRPQPQDSRFAGTGRGKVQDGRLCSQENKVKSEQSDTKASESRTKLQNDKSSKISQQERKSSGRRSAGSKEREKSLEVSDDCKRSSGRSRHSNPLPEATKDHQRRSEIVTQQKIEPLKEIPESVALLSAIKEIVSTYTKEEGIKISKMMNELHILSQASIIKNFIFLSDEIREARDYSGDYRALLEENQILQDNFKLLKIRYENIQRETEEMERIKEENTALKLKLQELTARESN